MADGATAEGPPRRRGSWNLKSIVEDVAGRPIGDFQDPDRPVHPYLKDKLDPPPARPRALAPEEPSPYDPIGHLYPPLVGAHGRAYHGPEHEHHTETIERHRIDPPAPGQLVRPPGPFHRPERLYLHYLLLHMDRLSDSGLRYLRLAVEEELQHRARAAPVPPPTAALDGSEPPAAGVPTPPTPRPA